MSDVGDVVIVLSPILIIRSTGREIACLVRLKAIPLHTRAVKLNQTVFSKPDVLALLPKQDELWLLCHETGPDGAVAKSSANGLVGTGFASRYQFQPGAGVYRPNG